MTDTCKNLTINGTVGPESFVLKVRELLGVDTSKRVMCDRHQLDTGTSEINLDSSSRGVNSHPGLGLIGEWDFLRDNVIGVGRGRGPSCVAFEIPLFQFLMSCREKGGIRRLYFVLEL